MKIVQTIILILILNSCSSQNTEFNNYLSGNTDLSPDKKHMLISYYKDYVASIYEVSTDGLLIQKLTNATKNNNHFNPQYSPDGNKILFISSTSTTTYLMIMNRDGTDLREIQTPNLEVFEAIFHPDNERILFVPYSLDNNNIYSIKYDGTHLKKLTNLRNNQIKKLTVLEDGEKIAFVYIDFDINNRKPEGIYSVNLDSPEKLRLEINTKTTENSKLPVDVVFQDIAVSPNNNIACDCLPFIIRFFKKENGDWVKSRENLKYNGTIFSIHFLNENEIIYTEHLSTSSNKKENVLKSLDLNTKAEKTIKLDI